MCDNEKLIKKCEKELQVLQQNRPVRLDDLDLSGYDDDFKETVINCVNTINKSYNERIKYWESLLNDLKGNNDV